MEILIRKLLFAVVLLFFVLPSANASSIFREGFEGTTDYCANANPAGWLAMPRSWTQTFSAPDGNPSAAYPSGVSFPTPVGSLIGSVRIVPITPFSAQVVNLYFDQVQARPQDGYGRAKPADSMFLAITPCSTPDLRPPDQQSPDPFARPACRVFENSGALVWSTGTTFGACLLNPWQTYYLQVAPINPVTLQHSCKNVPASEVGCDVGAVTSIGPAQ